MVRRRGGFPRGRRQQLNRLSDSIAYEKAAEKQYVEQHPEIAGKVELIIDIYKSCPESNLKVDPLINVAHPHVMNHAPCKERFDKSQ